MNKDEIIAHEQQRKILWCNAWCATASAANCTSTEAPTRYADSALRDFDKRFPAPNKKED